MKKLKVAVLTGAEEFNAVLEKYLRLLFPERISVIYTARLGDPTTLFQNKDIDNSDMWIIEAFSDFCNPEGFRTAKKYAGKSKILLLFTGFTGKIPEEGKFWLQIPSSKNVFKKIREVMEGEIPEIQDFQKLEEKWQRLSDKSYTHHHHR